MRSRHKLRFGLKLFVVVITAACVWLAVVSNLARSQKRAVDRVQELGGQLAFDYQFDKEMKWRRDPKLPAPAWLIDLVGADDARRATIVNVDEGSDPTDDELAVVERLDELQEHSRRFTDFDTHV